MVSVIDLYKITPSGVETVIHTLVDANERAPTYPIAWDKQHVSV